MRRLKEWTPVFGKLLCLGALCIALVMVTSDLSNELNARTESTTGSTTDEQTKAAPAADEVRLAEEVGEEVTIPEPGYECYTTLFTCGHSNCGECIAIRRLFETEPFYASLKTRTSWNEYPYGNWNYHNRFQGAVQDRFPTVMIQQPDGKIVLQQGPEQLFPEKDKRGRSVMVDRREFSKKLARSIQGCRPKPTPPGPDKPVTPPPSTVVAPAPAVVAEPELDEEVEEESSDVGLVYAAAAFIGLAVSVVSVFREKFGNL